MPIHAQIAPANSPTSQPSREELIEALAEWYATPEVLRETSSLNKLAGELGITAGGRFYELAHSAEVYHRMLVKTAGGALRLAPHILHVLAEKALDGHCRSAEIYLDFVRRVLTDERVLKALQPKPREVREVMEEVNRGAEDLLALAGKINDESVKATT